MRISSLTAALAAATLALTAAPAHAGTEDYTGGAIARQLDAGGHHFSTTFDGVDYPDYGLTLDAVLALDATGVGQAEAVQSTQYVADHIGEYAGVWPEAYSGATAKALVAAQAQGLGTTLGGLDLAQRLRALENKETGRFTDKSQYGEYSNTFGQSLALIGYRMAGITQSTNSVLFLKKQQCPGGGFRISMSNTACDTAADADPDATAIAIQGLYATKADRFRTIRLQRAVDYLASLQESNGSVPSAIGGGNTNSTGLALLGFELMGDDEAATKARYFLNRMRYGCSFPAGVRGLMAFDVAAKQAAAAEGDAKTANDQDRRGTVQGALGLSGVQLRFLTKAGATDAEPTTPC